MPQFLPTSIKISPTLRKKAHRLAQSRGLTFSGWLRQMMIEAVEQAEAKGRKNGNQS